jgi:hypothetical protein
MAFGHYYFQAAGAAGEFVLNIRIVSYFVSKPYHMNQFGGDWTEKKIEMVVGYAKAYLTIMNKYPQFKTLYFDGFAGSGDIYNDNKVDVDVVK